MFFVPLAIDKNIPDDPLQRDSPESAADGRGPAAFLHRQRPLFRPPVSRRSAAAADVQQYEGMAKEIWDNRAQTGEDPQWAGRMFGGMPAYLINVAYPAQLVKNTAGQIVKIINTPAAFVFFAMVSMWLMLLIVGVNPWVGIIPSLMYGLSTYFFLIIGAGHVTKMWALVYAPLMMGGAWLTLRSNMWLGGALTALFASLEIGANHPQITYYFLLAMAALWISEGIVAFRKSTCLRSPAVRRYCWAQAFWPSARTSRLCGTRCTTRSRPSAEVRNSPPARKPPRKGWHSITLRRGATDAPRAGTC